MAADTIEFKKAGSLLAASTPVADDDLFLVSRGGDIIGKVPASAIKLYAGTLNPMTTQGDMIVGGASGAPARLPVGSFGRGFVTDGVDPIWAKARRVELIGGATGASGTGAAGTPSGNPATRALPGPTSSVATGTTTTGAGVVYFDAGTQNTTAGSIYPMGSAELWLALDFMVDTLSDVTDTFLGFFGLIAPVNILTAENDGVYIRIDGNNVYGVARNGGIETQTALGTIAAATAYKAQCRWNRAAGTIQWYWGDTPVGALVSTNIPSTTLLRSILKIAKSAGTATRAVVCARPQLMIIEN